MNKPKLKEYTYKGFVVHCTQEPSLKGQEMKYYHIIDSEGIIIVDTFTCNTTPFSKFADGLKELVDDIIENPDEYYEDWNN